MKKIYSVLLLVSLSPLFSLAQTTKWFVTLTAAPGFGGPAGSIKSKMEGQGYADQEDNAIIGFTWSRDYPIKSVAPALLLKGGFKQKESRSIYFIAGVSSGTVEGFKKEGADYSWYPLIGGTTGSYVDYEYNLYQLGAGYEYAFKNTRTRLSVGPSVFIYNYKLSGFGPIQEKTSFIPGLNLNMRFPLGKEKRLFGVELFTDLNLAPPAQTKGLYSNEGGKINKFSPGSVNMVHGSAGLAFAFRRK